MAKKALQPPTLRYLEALRTELEAQYSEQDAQITRLRSVRENKQPVALPPDLKLVDIEVRDPAIADECQRIAATLSINPAKLQITPTKESEKAATNATLREHWTMSVLKVAGNRIPGLRTDAAAIDANLGDGGAWTKLLLTKDLWDVRYSIKPNDFEDEIEIDDDGEPKVVTTKDAKYNDATEEAKKSAGPPVTWLCCDVKCVNPVWQGNRLGEMLEVTERPQSSTFRKYRLGRDDRGNIVAEELAQGTSKAAASTSTVTFLEHWDATWVTYAIVGVNNVGEKTGQVVKQWKHRYGQVPYFYAPGIMVNYWRNRKVGWSISEAKRWLVEYRAYLWTLHAQHAARDVLPPLFRKRLPTAEPVLGKDGQPIKATSWRIGQLIEGQPGEEIIPLQFPAVAQSIQQQIAIVDKTIESLSTPRFSGQVGGLEGAGFALNQVLTESRIKYEPNQQSIERMLGEVTKFLWKLVRTLIKETVWVATDDGGWLGAGPDDLTDTVGVKWELSPERPSDQMIKNRYWSERLQNGTAHEDQAIEDLGDNPDEVRRGKGRDRIRRTPWYQMKLDQMVAAKGGRGDLLAEAQQQAEQMALTGQVGSINPAGNPMGNAGMPPDMAAAAMAPGGAGATPINSPVTGAPTGPQVPTQAATAGMQPVLMGT